MSANPVATDGYQNLDRSGASETTSIAGLSLSGERTDLVGRNVPPPDYDYDNGRPSSENSLSPEQAFAHMVKAMLGTGLLSLPLAFKHAGLYLGVVLTIVICAICLYCMRQVVHAARYLCQREGRYHIDYANVMRLAVESGPEPLCRKGYFFKQLVNVNMFISQLGFCCVYFVFMADNLADFFTNNTSITLSTSAWMLLLLIPLLSLCSIRRLDGLAPFAFAANIVYICAVAIVLFFFFTSVPPTSTLPAVGRLVDLPLFFGTVMFAFEGVAVILPIENRMREPRAFIVWSGVLNSSCLVVLAIFTLTGYYGYLALGDAVRDTATLNLPNTPFYQAIKLMFVACIMISYPLQFYVPMERVEKWVTRKIDARRQTLYVYTVRACAVFATCAIAELVPHLALFISLIGAFSGASMALLFPPCIDLLVAYSRSALSPWLWLKNVVLLVFALVGFSTGTYAALAQILNAK